MWRPETEFSLTFQGLDRTGISDEQMALPVVRHLQGEL
jgi:hypothetical protein